VKKLEKVSFSVGGVYHSNRSAADKVVGGDRRVKGLFKAAAGDTSDIGVRLRVDVRTPACLESTLADFEQVTTLFKLGPPRPFWTGQDFTHFGHRRHRPAVALVENELIISRTRFIFPKDQPVPLSLSVVELSLKLSIALKLAMIHLRPVFHLASLACH
jgi:hypothetical protein